MVQIMQDPRISLDETDSRLLAALQRNAHLTAQELGEALNLSPSQAGRRRQRLEAEGLITGYAARLDPLQLGLTVQAFVQVQMARHGAETSAAASRLVCNPARDHQRLDPDRRGGLSAAGLLRRPRVSEQIDP